MKTITLLAFILLATACGKPSSGGSNPTPPAEVELSLIGTYKGGCVGGLWDRKLKVEVNKIVREIKYYNGADCTGDVTTSQLDYSATYEIVYKKDNVYILRQLKEDGSTMYMLLKRSVGEFRIQEEFLNLSYLLTLTDSTQWDEPLSDFNIFLEF